jgi:hypothetical protein
LDRVRLKLKKVAVELVDAVADANAREVSLRWAYNNN